MMSDSGIKIVYLVYHHDHNFSPLLPAWSSPLNTAQQTIMVTNCCALCQSSIFLLSVIVVKRHFFLPSPNSSDEVKLDVIL